VERSDRRRNLMLPTIASIVQSANRSNVSIYAVDPGEGLPDEDSEQTLTRLAAETDGVALAGASALEEGLRRAANDASAYYLLTYQSAGKTDNKFHVIEVGVKRGDAKVRTRNGYWSLSPDDLMRAEVLARAKSPPETKPLEPAPRVSPLIRPWFGVSRGDGGMTRVTFVWEAAPQIPGTRSRRPPTRLLLTALGESETPLFEGDVLPVGSATPADETVPKRAVFDVPPGRVRLRMSIADATLAVIDSDVRNIAVRDLGAAVALGSPEVYRARNAREFRALADPMAVPVVTRVFSRTERLIIRVPAYATEGEPTVSATLMSRLGQPMRPLEISQTPSLKGVSQIDLPLAGLASADYLIEIRASHAAGEAKDTLSFRVTP
jgi:hypothetical protein